MALVYQGQINYPSDAGLQAEFAFQTCVALEESLLGEDLAVRRGISPSNWVWEQPRLLENGAAALTQELKTWSTKKNDSVRKSSDSSDI